MTKDEELQDAYNKLDFSERQVNRLTKELRHEYQVIQILIAAGFITQDKVQEARSIIGDLD